MPMVEITFQPKDRVTVDHIGSSVQGQVYAAVILEGAERWYVVRVGASYNQYPESALMLTVPEGA